jgi:hypothetical protein
MIMNADNTLLIIDWDNTCFPTTWFMKNSIDPNDPRYVDYFERLDNTLYRLFKKMNKYGKVVLVTNAMPIWVKTSSKPLKKTKKILKKTKIISARRNYQKTHPDAMDWKKLAFKTEATNENTNIVSIGDAEYEYYALIGLYNKNNSDVLLKSIKFLTEPTHDILIEQLIMLYNTIPNVCKATNHLDLTFKFTKDIRQHK